MSESSNGLPPTLTVEVHGSSNITKIATYKYDDWLIGMFDTVAFARQAVRAHNASLEVG